MRRFYRLFVGVVALGVIVALLQSPSATAHAVDDVVDNGDGSYSRYYTVADTFMAGAVSSLLSPTLTTILSSTSSVNTTLNNVFGLYGYGWSVSSRVSSTYAYTRVAYLFPVTISAGASCTIDFRPAVLDYVADTGIVVNGADVSVRACLYDADGNFVSSPYTSVVAGSSDVSITLSDVSSDASYLILCLFYPNDLFTDWTYDYFGLGLQRSDDGYVVITTYTSATVGLLGNIIGMLQSIVDTIAGIPDMLQSIGDTLSGIPDQISTIIRSISNLPYYISSYLMELFLPSADDLDDCYNDFDALLSDKLGAVWQVFDVCLGVFQGLLSASEDSSVDFPGLTIDLPSGSYKILPSGSVSIWPAGFGALETAVRTGVTAVIVLAWCKGLLARMHAILGAGGSDA